MGSNQSVLELNLVAINGGKFITTYNHFFDSFHALLEDYIIFLVVMRFAESFAGWSILSTFCEVCIQLSDLRFYDLIKMVLDLISTCLIFFGSGLVFGLSLYLLLYLAVAPFRKWLDGKVLFGAVLFSVVPALCLTPFVLNKMWFNNYKQLEAYLQQNPSCDMQLNYIDERGYSLGSWSLERYREYVSNKLKAERRDALDKIGFMMKCSSNPNFI